MGYVGGGMGRIRGRASSGCALLRTRCFGESGSSITSKFCPKMGQPFGVLSWSFRCFFLL